jgi:hypothetical protein
MSNENLINPQDSVGSTAPACGTARKAWRTPYVITGALEDTEAGVTVDTDGGATGHS